MKYILSLLLCISAAYGQTEAKNKAINVFYEGYVNGSYKIVVYNLQNNCPYVDLYLSYNGISPILISPTYNINDINDTHTDQDSVVILITAPQVSTTFTIGVQATTNCGMGDNSIVYVGQSTPLPVKFIYFILKGNYANKP
jgi:hypothetical protein